jgi:hypothetical protein
MKYADFDGLASRVRNWGRWGDDDQRGTLKSYWSRSAQSCGSHELSADCAADGRYTSLLSAPPLAFTNGFGSPVNPLALK